jgi:hypothetical protein
MAQGTEGRYRAGQGRAVRGRAGQALVVVRDMEQCRRQAGGPCSVVFFALAEGPLAMGIADGG